MLGNLARATYVGSTNFVWPFSYNKCNPRTRQSQEINACSKVNHYGLKSYEGRGSPEIDILESMQGDAGELPHTFIQRPYQSASLQISPGVEIDRPVLGQRPHKVSVAALDYSPTILKRKSSFMIQSFVVHDRDIGIRTWNTGIATFLT